MEGEIKLTVNVDKHNYDSPGYKAEAYFRRVNVVLTGYGPTPLCALEDLHYIVKDHSF